MEILIGLALTGLVVGALARLALPGPDPIPIWATILLGIAGAVIGAAIALPTVGQGGAFVASVVAATLLLFAYRRLVQKRPITGPRARRAPKHDADSTPEEAADRLRRLQELRDQGLISEQEFARKREQLVARL